LNAAEPGLAELLADPRLPVVESVRRDPGFRHVVVWRLVALAEAEWGEKPGLESRLDELVEQAGGHRLGMVDPWRAIPDVVRRALGRPLPPREDLYALPERLFPADKVG
jgi:hypothetical protein